MGDHKVRENFKIILHYVCDALRDLVPFAQFKKREKHNWRSVTFRKVEGFSLQLYLN